MDNSSIICPQCQSPYGYQGQNEIYMCPECGNEWNQVSENEITIHTTDELIVKDVNGVLLQNGDSVILIKDLPVKGAPKNLKSGTKVKNIRLVDGDHNIDCKIPGFGSMALKSEFVKKTD